MKLFALLLLTSTSLYAWTTTISPTYSFTQDNLDGERKSFNIYADSKLNLLSESYSSTVSLSYSQTKYSNFHELKAFKLKELSEGNYISDQTVNGNFKALQASFLQEMSHTMRSSLSFTRSWTDLSNDSKTVKLVTENDLLDKTHIVALSLIYSRIDEEPRTFVGHSGTVYVPEYYTSLIISLKDSIVLSKNWIMELMAAYRQKSDRPEAYNISMIHSVHITPLEAALHIGGSYFDEHDEDAFNATYGSMSGHSASAIWSQNVLDMFTIDLGFRYYYEQEALLNRPAYAKLASNTYSVKTEWNLPETFPETAGDLGIEDLFATVEFQYYDTNRDLTSKSIQISLKGTL